MPDMVADLMPLDIGVLMSKLQADQSLGLIPLMAGCSSYQLGALNAESFCERILSQANNTKRDDKWQHAAFGRGARDDRHSAYEPRFHEIYAETLRRHPAPDIQNDGPRHP